MISEATANAVLAHVKPANPKDDPLEHNFEAILVSLGVDYTRPERDGDHLDFYLPDFDLAVEVKAAPTKRLHRQLTASRHGDVLVLVGFDAVEKFRQFLVKILTTP